MGDLVKFDLNCKTRKLNELRERRKKILRERMKILLSMRFELEEIENTILLMNKKGGALE